MNSFLRLSCSPYVTQLFIKTKKERMEGREKKDDIQQLVCNALHNILADEIINFCWKKETIFYYYYCYCCYVSFNFFY